jgi:hypothetical protein
LVRSGDSNEKDNANGSTLVRFLRNILLAGLAISAIAGTAHAQASATSTTSASATIFRPITLTKDSDLRFGTIVRPASGADTITVSPADGSRSLSTNNAVALSSGSHLAPTRATYTVSGEGGQAFSISVPTSFNMTRSGGSETLTISLSASAASGTLTGALGNASSGTATFGVVGAMPITSSTASGAYSGSFVTTVSYN